MLTTPPGSVSAVGRPGPGVLATAARRLAALPQVPAQPVSQKPAAVLVPLYEDADGRIRVVLTLRSSKLKSHSGEVCLPGGKSENGDADAAATALREAHEECALPSDAVRIVKAQQRPVLSKHLLSVTPVIGLIDAATRKQLRASEAEVETIFDAPLDMFLKDTRAHQHKDVFWNDTVQYRLHFFKWQQDGRSFNIWGLTAGILIAVARRIFDRSAEFAETTPGQPDYTDIWYDGSAVVVRTEA